MSEKITVIDYDKIGTKGFPRDWKELGLQPPTKTVEVNTRQIPKDADVSNET